MVAVIAFLIGGALFFAKFVDKAFMEEDKMFETTFGVFYKKYRYWNCYASLYIFFFFVHRVCFVFCLNLTLSFSVTYFLMVYT